MIRHYTPEFETGPARIVLVDQEQDFVAGMSAELTAEGFICRGCTSIVAAVAAVKIERPDLLLITINVPGASGMEVGHRIRANSELASLPAIFLSATQIPDIIHRCDDGHGSYSVRKALDIGVLAELIEKMLPASAVTQAAH